MKKYFIALFSIILLTSMASAQATTDFFEGFEDGDSNGWDDPNNIQESVYCSGGGTWSAYEGNCYLEQTDDTYNKYYQTNNFSTTYNPDNITFSLNRDFIDNNYDRSRIYFNDKDGNSVISMTVRGSANGKDIQGTIGNLGSMEQNNEWLTIEMSNIDWSSDTIGNVEASGAISGTSSLTDVSFDNSASGIGGIELGLQDGSDVTDTSWDNIGFYSESSTNVTVSNFQPADGSNYGVDQSETITADISVESNEYDTVDVEGIFDGSIETVNNITADGSTNTVSFTKDFSNTGTGDFNYWFNIISDSPNGDTIDSTEVRTLSVSSDPPTYSLNSPADNSNFIKASMPFNQTFDFESTAGGDESWSFDFKIDKPDGATETLQSNVLRSAGQTYIEAGTYEFSDYGTYEWYVEGTGQDSGDVVTSTKYSFTVEEESATINFVKPSSQSGNYDGFEDGNYDLNPTWRLTESEEDLNVQQSTVYEGSYALQMTADNTITDFDDVGYVDSDINTEFKTMSFAGKVTDMGTAIRLNNGTSGYSNSVTYGLNDNGGAFVRTYDSGGSQIEQSNIGGVATGNWYEIYLKFNSDQNQVELRVVDSNGVEVGTNTASYSGVDQFDTIIIGGQTSSTGTESSYMDNIQYTFGKGTAYIDDLPYEAQVEANTENDGQATVEFIADGSIIKEFNIAGDSNSNNLTHLENYDTTTFDINSWVNVLGTEDQSIESTSVRTVDVVQSPEFNLVNPENDSRVKVDDREENEDTTEYEGNIEIGEAGEVTIQYREPNGTFQDVTTETFTDSDIGENKTILGNELIRNITLEDKSDENIKVSGNYSWRMLYDGYNSSKTFDSGNNDYIYTSQNEGVVEIPIIFFGQINDRIKDATGSTGQFFIATIAILVVAGGFHTLMRIPIVTIGTMVLLAFGFSVADGYYPIGVFWILLAVTGIASAYFGSKAFGGGG